MKLKANCLSYAAGGQSPDPVLLCSSPDLQTQMRNEIPLLQVDPLRQSIPENKMNEMGFVPCLEQE